MVRRKVAHPLASMAIRGLGRIVTKAVDHATASIAEDIRDFAGEIDRRAKRVIDRSRCRCDCEICQYDEHCGAERCGVRNV